jgi:uncharacterized protein (TIGR03435 family)
MKIRLLFEGSSARKLLCAVAVLAGISLSSYAGRAQAAPAPSAAATPAPALRDIVGIWQGTLHAAAINRDLRIVNKVGKDDKGELKVMDYSIDQGGGGLAANKATFEEGVLKYSIDPIQGKYEGKMSADGKTIAGMWTQGGNPLPLNFDRATPDTAWAIPEPPKPMPGDANPGFDVVTIKPSTLGRPGKGFGFRGRHFITFNTNVNDLIAFAYSMHSKQIVGAPDWFGTDLFDIDGVPDVEGQPSLKQMGVMVQKLLADRFKLTFHPDQRELSVYIITVAPGGPKMAKTTAAPNDPQGFGFRNLGDLNVRNMNIKEFASWMQSGVMDKPVVDQTGLSDKYDFTLKWTPDESQFAQFRGAVAIPPPSTDDPNAPPSLYTAVQEQIGLKIGPGKAPDEVIVIDHVDKPSAN